MRFPFDDFAVSEDIGRIDPTLKDPLVETIYCPKITFNRKMVRRPTMSEEQCRIRIEEKCACVTACPEAHRIKKKYRL